MLCDGDDRCRSGQSSRQRDPARAPARADAWSLLATQALLAPYLGRGAAVLFSFAAVTALVIATRRREGRTRAGARRGPGCARRTRGLRQLSPSGSRRSAPSESGSGCDPRRPHRVPDDPLLLAAVLGLAPVFEELLYRERLLLALRTRVGAGLAVAISSLLFALPHLEPWSVLATSLVGLVLGALMLVGGSVALCIGLHAGLNLAAVVCGIPPARLALPEPLALLCGVGALTLGLLAARRGRLGEIATDGH